MSAVCAATKRVAGVMALALILLLGLPRTGVTAGSIRVDVVRVSDGDSLVVRDASGQRSRIRLAGIDAPERSQPWSNVARLHLRSLVVGAPLWVEPLKLDRYDRLVVHARTEIGIDPAMAMLQAGLAWHFARYDPDLPPSLRRSYALAQAAARQAGTGLWADANPEPPWEFRRRNRAKRAVPASAAGPTSYPECAARWRSVSYSTTPAATDTFRLATRPAMGM